MRFLYFILSLLLFTQCNEVSERQTVVEEQTVDIPSTIVCDKNYDTVLVRLADDFTPSTIGLNKSLSPELQSFLLSVDTICLERQSKYKFFISTILGKLALHHLKCCNQGYDLYSMKEDAAAIVITGFEDLRNYKQKQREFLHSGSIIDYIKSDTSLMKEVSLLQLTKSYYDEEKRIEKGIF